MAWSTAQVARMSKVTSRTLRHYDEIGLLAPAWVGGNGYRYYEREQLLALQKILVLRELGLGLNSITEIVTQDRDKVDALRMHHAWLVAERDRFGRLADTVARTIEELEGGDTMTSAEHLFDGFDAAKQAEYEREARERWSDESIDASKAKVKGWSKQQWANSGEQWEGIRDAMLALLKAGAAPGDEATLNAVDAHYQWICQFWTPNRESYTGLGDLYADDERFRANYDKADPRLAEFMRAAMAAYAQQRL